jgi:hypothetical protein
VNQSEDLLHFNSVVLVLMFGLWSCCGFVILGSGLWGWF